MTQDTSGTIWGSLTLTRKQLADLRAGHFYVQINSQKAPEGNLFPLCQELNIGVLQLAQRVYVEVCGWIVDRSSGRRFHVILRTRRRL